MENVVWFEIFIICVLDVKYGFNIVYKILKLIKLSWYVLIIFEKLWFEIDLK